MEKISGDCILNSVMNNGPIVELIAQGILRQILEGVKHMHLNGVIHRDLNPTNVFVVGDK